MELVNAVRDRIELHRKTMLACLVFTFAWGLAAHGFMYSNFAIMHDSVSEFIAYSDIVRWKMILGRVLNPLYQYLIRGNIAMPWLVGFLALLFLSASVFVTSRLFGIKSNFYLFLLAGIFTCNISVIAMTATFITDLDCNMLALLFSVLAVYCWKRWHYGYLLGIVPCILSLCIYQSFICTTITLVMIYSILKLMSGESFKAVFLPGLRAVIMVLLSAALYFVIIKSVLPLFEINQSSGYYNSFDTVLSLSAQDILQSIVSTWKTAVKLVISPVSIYSNVSNIVHLILYGLVALVSAVRFFSHNIGIPEKILILVLVVFLPIGMNATQILTGNMSHDLMYFATALMYMFAFLSMTSFAKEIFRSKPLRSFLLNGCICVLTLFVLWGNVRLANEAYLARVAEHDALQSFMTRVITQIETRDDYVQGETPVLFVGMAENHVISRLPDRDIADSLFGMSYAYPWVNRSNSYMHYYLRYVMLNRMKVCNSATEERLEHDPYVQKMPSYPEQNSIQMIDDILVVKLGDLRKDDLPE